MTDERKQRQPAESSGELIERDLDGSIETALISARDSQLAALDVLVPPGIYAAAYLDYDEIESFRRPVWVCAFELLDGPREGARLPRFYNLPDGRPGRRHNLSLDFVAIAGRFPTKLLRPPQFLADCELSVVVTTVMPERERPRGLPTEIPWNTELPESAWYSRIVAITGVRFGLPPILRGSNEGSNVAPRNRRGRPRRRSR